MGKFKLEHTFLVSMFILLAFLLEVKTHGKNTQK